MNTDKYLAEFQIVGCRTVQLRIKNDIIFLDDSKQLKRKIDISHMIVDIEEDDRQFQGLLQMNISVNIADGKSKFSLNIQLEGCFTGEKNMGEEQFRTMLGLNGVTAIYGLARAQIAAISSHLFIAGNILLPMINVVQYSRDLAEKVSTQ